MRYTQPALVATIATVATVAAVAAASSAHAQEPVTGAAGEPASERVTAAALIADLPGAS